MPSVTCAVRVPRLVAGSSGTPECSRRRSSASSSAAAGTEPSSRKRALAGGPFGKVSGTSNTPLVIDSLRPAEISTLPRPTLMVAVRPVTRTLKSASRIAGRPCTGRISAPCPTISTASPSSGIGGPLDFMVDIGALVAIISRSTVPPAICSSTQARTLGAPKNGQIAFIAATDMRVPATPTASRGSPLE